MSEWKSIPVSAAGRRLTTAHVSRRPGDLCAGGTFRLLQSGERSRVVIPQSPWPFTSRPIEMYTWDVGIAPELVRQMAPIRGLWTPTPHKEDPGHGF